MRVSLHTARAHRICDNYGPPAHPILPGDLYVRHVTFPGEEGNEEGTKPVVHHECGHCVNQRGEWVRAQYGVTVKLGDQVEFNGQPATVIDFVNGGLLLRVHGASLPIPVHPRWNITYREAS